MDSTPWTAKHACTGVGAGSQGNSREYEKIDVDYHRWYLQASVEERKKNVPNWFSDVTQGVQFNTCGNKIGTILMASRVYSYELDSVLSVKDLSGVMGIPWHTNGVKMRGGGHLDLTGMVGESLHLAVLASILYPII